VNVKLYDAPGFKSPELKAVGPDVEVQVWTTWSSLVTLIVVPATTVILGGLKAKLWIARFAVGCDAVVGGEVVGGDVGGVVARVLRGGLVRGGAGPGAG
jgi:hypothetical protein